MSSVLNPDSKPDRTEALRLLAAAYRDETKESESALGRRFAADSRFFARLDVNQPTRRKYDLVVARFADSWPNKARWPAKVPQPEKSVA